MSFALRRNSASRKEIAARPVNAVNSSWLRALSPRSAVRRAARQSPSRTAHTPRCRGPRAPRGRFRPRTTDPSSPNDGTEGRATTRSADVTATIRWPLALPLDGRVRNAVEQRIDLAVREQRVALVHRFHCPVNEPCPLLGRAGRRRRGGLPTRCRCWRTPMETKSRATRQARTRHSDSGISRKSPARSVTFPESRTTGSCRRG